MVLPEESDIKILHIDDDVALAQLLKRKFRRSGAHVLHTDDHDQAIEQLKTDSFDVVVLDHYLGSVTGHQVLSRFQELAIKVPVVYITGSNEARVAIDALKNGASDYVIKSINEDFFPLLLDAIQQTVANARLRAAKEKADEDVRVARDRAEALLSEMNHRVANSLALVTGLLRLQSNNTDNIEVKDALSETQSRISAIGAMHRSLYTSDNVSEVEMKPYLLSITHDLAATIGNTTNAVVLKTDIDAFNLPAEKAVSAGMVVSELVTNAIKYAYPDGHAGEIRVSLKLEEDQKAVLLIADDGVGLAGAQANAQSTGLGSKIVKSMAASLGSGIEYPPVEKGMAARVEIDLSLPGAGSGK